jgi:D-alanyl-D-alanine carboxypeptidase/D-alanyl-D-alanine-endopeptidase (penicillin-binding protein 4)
MRNPYSSRSLSLLLIVFFSIELFVVHATCASELPTEVGDALQRANIPLANIGVVVWEVNATTPLIQFNAKQAMNPASTMKLLTTYAALEILGPAYTWKTEAYIDGRVDNGVLAGNLIIKGYGNPKFNAEHLWLWLQELRNRGLREIKGDLLLDRSAFEPQDTDPAAFDNDPFRAYNVVPDALLLNFNALRLRFIPAEDSVNIYTEPALSGFTLDNRLNLKKQLNCGDWDRNIQVKLIENTIRIQGTYPSPCGEHDKAINLLPQSRYFDAVFRSLWQQLGGTFQGISRDEMTPASAVLWSTYSSQPLSEIIRDINKFSNNVMARQLFLSLSLGKEPSAINIPAAPLTQQLASPTVAAAGAASLSQSERILRTWLSDKALEFPELVLENGAGLSRKERITPSHLAVLLQAIQQSPFSAEIEASLPIIGIDGTLKKRLDNCAVTTHAHLKTGSLEGVKSLAGYVQSRSGKQWILVFIINHPNAAHGQLAQDALIEWLEQVH